MKWEDFFELAKEYVALSDGSMGVFLQSFGLKGGECPDLWNITHPEIIEEVHKRYIASGSNLITTNTFGANRIKLTEFGLQDKIREINSAGVRIAKKVANGKAIVAGDVGPTGKLIYPLGELSFDEAYKTYKEQIEILANEGVDCIILETHIDILEIKAAILAAKDVGDIPIIASVTFESDGRMLTGTPPETAFLTLQALGADVVGTNCGTGPEDMFKAIGTLPKQLTVPVIVQANAGTPQLINGKTTYNLNVEKYTDFALQMVLINGASIIGGCCGTTPDHIALIKEKVTKNKSEIKKMKRSIPELYLTSRFEVTKLGFNLPFVVIGERLNPTGKKNLATDIKEERFEILKDEAIKQAEAGANILDLNVSIPETDELNLMIKAINLLSNTTNLPISIDTSNPVVAKEALKIYPGIPLLNSISLEEERIKLLPEIKKTGACFIALPIEKGVPTTLEERKRNIKKILKLAEKYGIGKEKILADPLVTTISANKNSAKEALKTIRLYTEELGLYTTMGLSNISFGLPERKHINRSFLAMAISSGLTSAIVNPFDTELMGIIKASDVLLNKDPLAERYINLYSRKETPSILNITTKEETTEEKIYRAVLKGNKEVIKDLLDEAIKKGVPPLDIMNKTLIPAITEVGKLYEEKIYFLPQLMLSAETMKIAFNHLEPLLKEDSMEEKGKIVFATVKGDVHDIGKNIVVLMLRNYGFKVYDLGKDVPNEIILKKAIEVNADLIGLSALMTTTMPMMKEFMELQKRENTRFKVMVGGAAVSKSFADSIGAYYSNDAVGAVKLSQTLLKKE